MVRCSRRFLVGFQYLLLLFFFGTSTVLATLQLHTIDDEFGDSYTGVQPVYFPTQAWYQGTNELEPAINRSLASQGTWHGSFYDTARLGITFSFTGTALSVWCIIPNPNYTQHHHHTPPTSVPTIIYKVIFILDGIALAEDFTHISDSSDVFQYNVSIFSIENLSNTTHSFTMITSSTDPDSSILFDYATYLSFQDTPTSFPILTKRNSNDAATGSKSNLGVVLGAVLGGLAIVIIIVLAVWYHLRWKRRHRLAESQTRAQIRTNKPPNRFTVDPFILDPLQSTLPRYHDYSPGPSSYSSSSQTQSNTNSSSGGGSRYGPLVPLQPLRSSLSSPVLSPSTSNEVLRNHGAPALLSNSLSSPTSPSVSQLNSHANIGSSQETANRHTTTSSSSSSRRPHHDRRHRHHRHRQRERIAEMRREVATLRAQHQEILARMEPPLPPLVDDQSPNHEKLPEYTR